MNYVGVDLHKHSITVCVVVQEATRRKITARATLRCCEPEKIREWFEHRVPFQVVVEATASYEWFLQLVEPFADRILLAHPKKLRVIAESTRKTDKLDAQVLAEFLSLDMIPTAHRPTPRVRQHRRLVRYRIYVKRRITGLKTKLRDILAGYNGDVDSLFSRKGRAYLKELALSAADRFVTDQLLTQLEFHEDQLTTAEGELRKFAKSAPVAEREARGVLDSIPCVGPVTIDVVLSELGDIRRFGSQKKVVAYAGLAPGIRESAGHRKEIGITHEGSRLLRWALVETAWRLVGKTRRWAFVYDRLKARRGAKKAIVAVARRILCVMAAMLRSGQRYSMVAEAFR